MSQFNPHDLTVVFITYNRSQLLKITSQAIRASRRLQGVKVICSDDCSKPEHLSEIERMGFDKVVKAQRNGGLGRNNNKGLKAANSRFVLMVQDDCKMVNDEAVLHACQVLSHDPSIGMVRLYGDPTPFPLQERKVNGMSYWVAMHTSPEYEALKRGPVRKRVYSDQPHVRRRELHEKVVGYYAEGVPLEQTERDFEDRMDAQSELFVAFLNPFERNDFVHLGAQESFRTNTMRQRMDRFILAYVEGLGLRGSLPYNLIRSAYRMLQTSLERAGVMR